MNSLYVGHLHERYATRCITEISDLLESSGWVNKFSDRLEESHVRHYNGRPWGRATLSMFRFSDSEYMIGIFAEGEGFFIDRARALINSYMANLQERTDCFENHYAGQPSLN